MMMMMMMIVFLIIMYTNKYWEMLLDDYGFLNTVFVSVCVCCHISFLGTCEYRPIQRLLQAQHVDVELLCSFCNVVPKKALLNLLPTLLTHPAWAIHWRLSKYNENKNDWNIPKRLVARQQACSRFSQILHKPQAKLPDSCPEYEKLVINITDDGCLQGVVLQLSDVFSHIPTFFMA